MDALLEEYKVSKTGNLKAVRDTISVKIDLNSSIGNQVEDEEIEKEKEILQIVEVNTRSRTV